MQSPAPANGKYALRTGRVLDRPIAILEFSRLGTATPEPIEIEEVAAEDLIEEIDDAVVTPAPPVIAKIVRTTHVEMPPVRNRAKAHKRGPSVLAMIGTVALLAAIGAGAGFGMRALAQPPIVGASAALSGGVGAPGDREQRDRHAPRIASPTPPSLAAPPAPDTTPAKAVGAVGAVAPRITKAAPAAHAAHANHAPRHATPPPAARGAKKRAAH